MATGPRGGAERRAASLVGRLVGGVCRIRKLELAKRPIGEHLHLPLELNLLQRVVQRAVRRAVRRRCGGRCGGGAEAARCGGRCGGGAEAARCRGGEAKRRRGADLFVGELTHHYARGVVVHIHGALEGRSTQGRVESREEGEAEGREPWAGADREGVRR